MKNHTAETKKSNVFVGLLAGLGGAIGIWSAAALFSALGTVNFQVGELVRQYLVAIGMIREFETLVDFYTHIKGVEYIICIAFLATFPVFFKYLNRVEAPASKQAV